MKKEGCIPILTNLVGVHPRNIHTKCEANPCSGLREDVEKVKKFTTTTTNDNNRHRVIASHTHSLSVTKNSKNTQSQQIRIS